MLVLSYLTLRSAATSFPMQIPTPLTTNTLISPAEDINSQDIPTTPMPLVATIKYRKTKLDKINPFKISSSSAPFTTKPKSRGNMTGNWLEQLVNSQFPAFNQSEPVLVALSESPYRNRTEFRTPEPYRIDFRKKSEDSNKANQSSQTKADTPDKHTSAFTKSELELELEELLHIDRQGLERLLSNLMVGMLDVLTSPASSLREVEAKTLIRRTVTNALGTEVLPRLKPSYRHVLSRLVDLGEDAALPLTAIRYLQDLGGNRTACLQRLLCRASPFVWGLQQSLSESNRLVARDDHRCLSPRPGWWPVYLPTKGALGEFSENCDQRFPLCQH